MRKFSWLAHISPVFFLLVVSAHAAANPQDCTASSAVTSNGSTREPKQLSMYILLRNASLTDGQKQTIDSIVHNSMAAERTDRQLLRQARHDELLLTTGLAPYDSDSLRKVIDQEQGAMKRLDESQLLMNATIFKTLTHQQVSSLNIP